MPCYTAARLDQRVRSHTMKSCLQPTDPGDYKLCVTAQRCGRCYTDLLRSSFIHNLKHNCSSSRMNIRFHEKQRLPGSELYLSLSDRQSSVRRQQDRSQMRMSVRGMSIVTVSRDKFFEERPYVCQKPVFILSQNEYTR